MSVPFPEEEIDNQRVILSRVTRPTQRKSIQLIVPSIPLTSYKDKSYFVFSLFLNPYPDIRQHSIIKLISDIQEVTHISAWVQFYIHQLNSANIPTLLKN